MGRKKDGLDRLADRLARGEIDEATYHILRQRLPAGEPAREGMEAPSGTSSGVAWSGSDADVEETAEAAREAAQGLVETVREQVREQMLRARELLLQARATALDLRAAAVEARIVADVEAAVGPADERDDEEE